MPGWMAKLEKETYDQLVQKVDDIFQEKADSTDTRSQTDDTETTSSRQEQPDDQKVAECDAPPAPIEEKKQK